MPKKKIRFWMVLTLLIPISFALGYALDDCKEHCFPVAFVKEMVNSNDGGRRHRVKVKVARGEEGDHDVDIEIPDIAEIPPIPAIPPIPLPPPSLGETYDDTFERSESQEVKLPDTAGLKKIVILSRNTHWTLESGSKANLSFSEEARVYFKRKGDTLTIQTKNHAAEEATFTIPDDFDGLVQFNGMNGGILVRNGKWKMKELDLSSLSGDVEVEAYPSDRLAVNVTSGDIRTNSDNKVAPKEVRLQSVSGDMDLTFKQGFETLSVDSVSGEMRLDIPNNLAVDLNLTTISGEFSGLPENGTTVNQPGHHSFTGQYGKEPKAKIRFHSVGGGFTLSQSELSTPNL